MYVQTWPGLVTKIEKEIENFYSSSMLNQIWAFVVTSTQNHWIIHLFNITKILNKFKIFNNHSIGKFSNNIDLRKLDSIYSTKILWNMSSLLTFVKTERSLIFSWLKKSSFLKSMLIPNLHPMLFIQEIKFF